MQKASNAAPLLPLAPSPSSERIIGFHLAQEMASMATTTAISFTWAMDHTHRQRGCDSSLAAMYEPTSLQPTQPTPMAGVAVLVLRGSGTTLGRVFKLFFLTKLEGPFDGIATTFWNWNALPPIAEAPAVPETLVLSDSFGRLLHINTQQQQ